MPLINRLNISGSLNEDKKLTGKLSSANDISGMSRFPDVIDRTAIHYDTTENWNANPLIIGERSHIYIYSDYSSIEKDGETVYIPAIKIGDGTSYLTDMPFITSDSSTAANVIVKTSSEWAENPSLVSVRGTIYVYMDSDNVRIKIGDGNAYVVDLPFVSVTGDDFSDHINNTVIHVTAAEKAAWNNKWRGYMTTADGENLVFTTN